MLGLVYYSPKEDFFELGWDYFKRCKEENILHTEIFFDPQTHTARGVAFSEVIEGLIEATAKGKRGVRDKFISDYVFFKNL